MKREYTFRVVVFSLLLFSQLSIGADTQQLVLKRTYGYMSGMRVNLDEFIAPNEKNPARILPFVKDIPHGAYISVGTERGFLAASMIPQVSLLVLLDVSEAAVVFNRINTLLLKISQSRSDYGYLRFKATHSEWLAHSKKVNLTEEEKVLLSQSHFNWWESTVRKNEDFAVFNRNPRWRIGLGVPFKNANYLFYDKNFEKIQALAKADKIWTYNINIADIPKLTAVLTDIQTAGYTVSVWDESNVRQYFDYSGTQGTIINALLPFTDPKSVHLSTLWDNLMGLLAPKRFRRNGPWHQYAHTFGFLTQYELTYTDDTLVDTSQLCSDVLSGRIREKLNVNSSSPHN